MNLKKLKLHNFQSHQDTELEFAKGISCIIGSSDEGKSSIVRALAAVLQNDVNNSYVRHGEDCFEVTVEFDDGSFVTRIKGPKVNKYIVNGEEFERLGDSIPKKVIDVLGHASVFVDDTEIPVTISKQGVEPFLLSESAPVRAKMLGMISGLDVIDRALREMQKDSNQADKDIKVAEGVLGQQEKELKEVHDELLIKEAMYLALGEAVKRYRVALPRHEALFDLRHKLGFLNVDIEAAKSEMLVLDVVVNTVSFERLLKAQDKWNRLLSLRDSYRQNEIGIAQLRKAADQLLGMDFEDINGRLEVMRVNHGQVQRLDRQRREWDTVQFAITKLKRDEKECQSTLDSLRKELSSFGVCPFCMRGISDEYMGTILEKM